MTSPFNPYQPPTTDEPEPIARASDASVRLASLEQRWLAAMIDGLLAVLVVAPLQYHFGMFARAKAGISFWELTLWALIYFAVWLVENGYCLATNAQTIGKRVVGIRVDDIGGGRAALWKLVLVRNLPFSCVANLPAIGGVLLLADTFLIFRKDRRCLHDHLAGTHVVRVR